MKYDCVVVERPHFCPYLVVWISLVFFVVGFIKKLIDYEVDSDDEWEDIVDGESIADSDKGEEEDEKPVDDEEDDGFFVPHGHLSDDEIDDEDERMVFLIIEFLLYSQKCKVYFNQIWLMPN